MNAAGFVGEGGDPRLSISGKAGVGHGIGQTNNYTRPQHRKLHDSNVSFEEYNYYAEKTRAMEDASSERTPKVARTGLMATIFPSKSGKGDYNEGNARPTLDEKEAEHGVDLNEMRYSERGSVSDEDWIYASRALRTATAASMFYLITTDILGPFGVG